MSEPQPSAAEAAMRRSTLLVADAIGNLMAFWNFKPSMGQVWAVLYLSREPLSAEEIAVRTGLSAGSVSMTLQALLQWGVVKRGFVPASRRRHFEAETDVIAMVTRVIRDRELTVVDEALHRLEEAVSVLEREAGSTRPDDMLHRSFLLTRVRNLVRLARSGREILDSFARAGSLDLRGIRGALRRGA